MPKQKPVRRKHVPQRTCVGCREVLPKRTLIRIVRTGAPVQTGAPTQIGAPAQSGAMVQVDPSGKLAGRGAYLHDRRACWERSLKGALAHALKMELSEEDRKNLYAYMETLPEEAPEPEDKDHAG